MAVREAFSAIFRAFHGDPTSETTSTETITARDRSPVHVTAWESISDRPGLVRNHRRWCRPTSPLRPKRSSCLPSFAGMVFVGKLLRVWDNRTMGQFFIFRNPSASLRSSRPLKNRHLRDPCHGSAPRSYCPMLGTIRDNSSIHAVDDPAPRFVLSRIVPSPGQFRDRLPHHQRPKNKGFPHLRPPLFRRIVLLSHCPVW